MGLLLTIEYHTDKYRAIGAGLKPPAHSCSLRSDLSGASFISPQSCSCELPFGSESSPPVLRNWPIKEVFVDFNCVSLTAYLTGFEQSTQAISERLDEIVGNKKRFIPLIIDESHSLRALPLLEQELVRMDCLKEAFYTFSVSSERRETCASRNSTLGSDPTASKDTENDFVVIIEPLPAELAWKAHKARGVMSKNKSKEDFSRGLCSVSDSSSDLNSILSPSNQPKLVAMTSIQSSVQSGLREFSEESCQHGEKDCSTKDCFVSEISGVEVGTMQMHLQPPVLPEFDSLIGFRVISAVMNSMISQFVIAAESKIQLSSDSLFGYMAFHHMLLFFAARDPTWRNTSNKIVEEFVANPAYRHKSHTPDLGRFLVHLLLSDRGWDADVSRAYILECFKRQVSWYLDPKGDKLKLGFRTLKPT